MKAARIAEPAMTAAPALDCALDALRTGDDLAQEP